MELVHEPSVSRVHIFQVYRGGLTLFARKVMLRTRHACHIQNQMDQVCLPYKFFWGLEMLAMLGILGTRYACHVNKKWDQTCLPYKFCFGPGMPAIFSHMDQVCHIIKRI